MMTKYGFTVVEDVINKDLLRLTNQIWKLIPMREHEEDWLKQLNTIIVEISGLNEIFAPELSFTILLSKLEGLKTNEHLDFYTYRKTVFEAINLLQELKKQ